jgi:hypothetical protein
MDRGRIFLARLSHGAIGQENSQVLGALLVAKFHQMALGRERSQESDRRYFWLYVDEFQNVATPSMASLLSGVRKYRLGLVLAHQELHQLESTVPDVASAVLSNAYTRVCFRVGDQDAKRLEGGLAAFEATDLRSLGTGEAIVRLERPGFDFNLSVPRLPDADRSRGESSREDHRRFTRAVRDAACGGRGRTAAGSRSRGDPGARGWPSSAAGRTGATTERRAAAFSAGGSCAGQTDRP